jgi:hypothetical protein
MDWATKLRVQLRKLAEDWARSQRLPSYNSLGHTPTVLFSATSDGARHGNFYQAAWSAIAAEPHWKRRLGKIHSRSSALPEEYRASAKELDSSNSSDALLMNCFCPYGAAARIGSALGLCVAGSRPEFGYNPRLPLIDGVDATEIDIRLGGALFEAKLTERDFTSRPRSHVLRYTRLEDCFDLDLLPGTSDAFDGYQLIRNVLAAAKDRMRLVVLIDYRRPDLLQQWWKVHGAITSGELRNRCEVHSWQEVAAACDSIHRKFLEDKYGL